MSLKTKSPKNQSAFFIVVSWLLARLWWSVEISRLAILRMQPKVAVSKYHQQKFELFPGNWIYEGNKLSCVSVDENNQLLITQIQIESN